MISFFRPLRFVIKRIFLMSIRIFDSLMPLIERTLSIREFKETIFDKDIFVRNEVLRGDAIYNLSFRFRNINLNNINDIYLAISIIAVIIESNK